MQQSIFDTRRQSKRETAGSSASLVDVCVLVFGLFFCGLITGCVLLRYGKRELIIQLLNSNKAFYEESDSKTTKPSNTRLSDNFKGSEFIHQIADFKNNVTLSELTKAWLGIEQD